MIHTGVQSVGSRRHARRNRLAAADTARACQARHGPSRARAAPLTPAVLRRTLLAPEQLDFEPQRRVRRNSAARARRAVAELRWDRELADAADLHGRDAFVPA